ncbi:glycoside hydrolase family 38 C-terminal domain-containing protein [Niabella yanshanensis]|uniref:Glycoside hydrolase family 38 C-terminal domain-containing protein n=1 Tax=Niabella yanshanensis TaxID=577386 RepID=A0ABZ0W8V9_9BACT|nr:glycoside hydrolase family 38 C-terminal domain-containing protein [Niabella yanshanensis]WQD39698.1 glycoside hydrolase family 38 C-terminal domain-containing protein [Niabella yanshanensis]
MRLFLSCVIICISCCAKAQPHNATTNYFVDGYHGGMYGHYPLWVTRFIADHMEQRKDWKLNLEIEPDTWDLVALKDPVNYQRLKTLINDSTHEAVAEYVNPTYAQSYLFNSSVESTIRQFQYGMEKLKQHFPLIRFTTYSSEEPCFTSALPQILQSLGISNASLKNPNTCWGGYVRAYGGQLLNWVGPDGSSVKTVPRYSSESLVDGSTWQTIAWNHSEQYLNSARQQGIEYPVGMCLQDAGWKNGPWLNHQKSAATAYTTWRSYFNLLNSATNIENWRLSQEDIKVSLVWGAQILQRIAQQVRVAENKIKIAEKTAALARFYRGTPYPKALLDSAWKNILLAQHHDCWIVPYNKLNKKTWAENVADWTTKADQISDSLTQQSLRRLAPVSSSGSHQTITVYNPTSVSRDEVVSFKMSPSTEQFVTVEYEGKKIPSQVIKYQNPGNILLFKAKVPALGSSIYTLVPGTKTNTAGDASIARDKDGDYILKTDLYELIVDSKRGNIRQLTAKALNNKNFIAPGEDNFNTLRGFFYKNNKFSYSFEECPKITILQNGPLQIKLLIEGKINNNRYSQTLQLQNGEKRIDLNLCIDYEKETGIGDGFKQGGGYKAEDYRKAFYNDTSKLLVRFPFNLHNQRVYKDAPLDVTESELDNTFYNRWDKIKNNVLFNWVDITDAEKKYGIALLSDHVTSYSHGAHFPLSLTVQYAGVGLWGRNYTTPHTTSIRYALIPHSGDWQKANLNTETLLWNEPLITSKNAPSKPSDPFVHRMDPGLEISAMYYKNDDLYIRVMNTGSTGIHHKVSFNISADKLHFVELDDRIVKSIQPDSGKRISFNCDIPLFGFKTIKMTHAKPF